MTFIRHIPQDVRPKCCNIKYIFLFFASTDSVPDFFFCLCFGPVGLFPYAPITIEFMPNVTLRNRITSLIASGLSYLYALYFAQYAFKFATKNYQNGWRLHKQTDISTQTFD